MKEERFFYTPDIAASPSLPDDEAQHAVRVLRLVEGDEVWCMDGRGTFYRCEIALATRKACEVNILEELPQRKTWRGRLTLAIAPTKNMDRMEWMVEKAVEIGIDRIVPLLCKNSERTVIKTERLERIAVSAMKQSRKPWLTEIAPMARFEEVIAGIRDKGLGIRAQGFIAHCHDGLGDKPFLMDAIAGIRDKGLGMNVDGEDLTVLVGPEGDFTVEEVQLAMESGMVPVSLGESRLRTETAGLVAAHIMQLKTAIR